MSLGNKVTLHRSPDGQGAYGDKIADIVSMELGERTAETTDETTYGSDDDYKEFGYGLRDGGEVSVTARYKLGQTDIDALIADFEAGNMAYLQLRFPASINKQISFKAVVTKVGHEIPKEGRINRALSFKVSGKPVEAALA